MLKTTVPTEDFWFDQILAEVDEARGEVCGEGVRSLK